MVLWGGNFIVVKSAVAVLPPVGFTFLRFVLATATLFVLLRWREGSVGLPRRDLVAIMGFGALGFGVYQILWTTGLTTVPAGDSALIIAATPVFVALLAVVAGTDVLTPTKLAGVLRLVRRGRGRHRVRARADARRLDRRRGDHARRRVLLVDLHGLRRAVPAALLAAPGDGLGIARRDARPRAARDLPAPHRSTSAALGPEVGLAILYSGFLAAGVSNVLVMNGVKVVGPTRTAALQFLVPAHRGRPRGGLPVRADPAGSDRRRRRDPRRGRPHPAALGRGRRAEPRVRPTAPSGRTPRTAPSRA